MPQYLADNAYLAIKPETTAGTAVIPTVFVPLVSENIRTVVNHTVDRRMKGIDWEGNDLLRGNRMHEGEFTILADPDNLGHILNMLMLKGSTTGDATDGYTHPFTVGAPQSYTIEIKKGLYAQRYFGVYIDELKIDFSDGQMQLTCTIKAMGQLSVMHLGEALAGAVTTLELRDNYDLNPNRGLVVGDKIQVGTNELTLTAVDSGGTQVGFTSTSLTYSIGEPIYLKPLSVTQPTLYDPFYFGNLLVGFGVDESAATTAAGSRSTATPVYDLEIVIKNNLFAQNGSNRFDPVQIIPRTKSAMLTLKQLLEDENERAAFLHRTKQAITIIAQGQHINPDFSTREQLTLKFHNVKLIESPNPLEVGEFIKDEQSFAAVYDDGDAVAMSASLINRTAAAAY